MAYRILGLMASPDSNEVEIKFRVADVGPLVARLRQLGFQQITPRTHEMNVLFDLPGHPLRDRGEVLRLRKYGEIWALTHKSKSKNKDGPHKTRIETETRVENGEKMETILRALQFEPAFRYEKFRAEWKSGDGHVVIDETPIGNFGEIEGPPEWIDSVARDLLIDRKDYITETYAGLFSAWKRETGSNAQEMTFNAVGTPPRT
jgi:adenylate cyclase, class 2